MSLIGNKILTLICVWFTFTVSYAQMTVIDNKGTLKEVDTSKWTVSNGALFAKNNLNVGIGLIDPQAKLHTSGSLRFDGLNNSITNSNLLTTDVNGNVAVSTFASLISGNAITSLNGLTSTSQSFSLGTSGTDFNLSSLGTLHTFNLPTASASNRGALSASDWTLFNNKQNNIIDGTISQYWRGDKTWQTLNTTAVAEGSNLYFTNTRARTAISLTTSGTSGVATYNSSTGELNIPNYNINNFSLNGLTPSAQTMNTGNAGNDFAIASSGSTHTFNLPTASATNRGALSSVDWATFNNKISTINVSAPLASTVTGSSVDIQLNRSSIVTGTSDNSANIPLTLDANASNSVVSANNVAFNINNTAPLWNASQLRGRNLSTAVPTNGQILKWDDSNWTPANEVNLQVTGVDNSVRVGVNTGGVIANSTFRVEGSVSNSIVTTNAPLTLTEAHYTVIVTANVTITLPAASTCVGRIYIVKKTHNSSGLISTYINLTASTSTTLARGVYHLISDGTSWQQL